MRGCVRGCVRVWKVGVDGVVVLVCVCVRERESAREEGVSGEGSY